jgi:methionine aminopeptidase
MPGNRVGDISWAIEKTITDADFKPVKNLCGHYIGNSFMEIGRFLILVIPEKEMFCQKIFFMVGTDGDF